MNNNKSANVLLGARYRGGECFLQGKTGGLEMHWEAPLTSSLQSQPKRDMTVINRTLGPGTMYLLPSFEWWPPLFRDQDQQSAAMAVKL